MHNPVIKISPSGETVVIYHPNDEHATDFSTGLGAVTEDARGGRVLPRQALRRLAFQTLRRIFGGRGRVAAWTRHWRGPWIVQRADTGETLPGIYESHEAAVEAEVAWLMEEVQ